MFISFRLIFQYFLFPLENLTIELLKFVACILARINITNSRLPAHLKIQSIELLDETKCFLNAYLNEDKNISVHDSDLFYYLECYFNCGLVYLLQYRFSIMSSAEKDSESSVIYSQTSLNELQTFLNDLNIKFKLTEKIEKQLSNLKSPDLKLLFFLVKLI